MSAFDSLARSALQRVAEIMAFKASLETAKNEISTKDLHAKWDARFKKSSSKLSVPVSFNFVDQAVRLSNGLLAKPAIRKALLALDNSWGKGSPLNTVESLVALQAKTKSDQDTVLWIIAALHDQLTCQLRTIADFSPAYLTGSKGSKGAFDVFIAKKALHQLLLFSHLAANNFPSDALETLRAVCSDHETFRRRCGGGCVKADIAWQGLLPEHTRKA